MSQPISSGKSSGPLRVAVEARMTSYISAAAVPLRIGSAFSAVGGAFAFEGIMGVRAHGSFATLLRTTAQGVIFSVARFAAAAFAAVTPLILATGPAVLWNFHCFSRRGHRRAWLVFRTRDDHSDFDPEVQLISEAFRYKVSSADVAG